MKYIALSLATMCTVLAGLAVADENWPLFGLNAMLAAFNLLNFYRWGRNCCS